MTAEERTGGTVEFSEYTGAGFGVGITQDGTPDPHLEITLDDAEFHLEIATAVGLAVDLLIYAGAAQTLEALWATLGQESPSGRSMSGPAKRALMELTMEQTSRTLGARRVLNAEAMIARTLGCDPADVSEALDPFLTRLIEDDDDTEADRAPGSRFPEPFLTRLMEERDDDGDTDDVSTPGEPARDGAGSGPGPAATE